MYKNCQSCGMPLERDPQGGGSNSDGSKSEMYCSFCYQGGEFTRDCTAEEMREFCKEKIMERGVSEPDAEVMVKKIPELERWKK
jgi:hypothetical protein